VTIKFSTVRTSASVTTRSGDKRGSADGGAESLRPAVDAQQRTEGAFYGPKLEYVLRERHRPRTGQCGTVQVDLTCRAGSAPSISTALRQVTPGDAPPRHVGSLERFTGILIEHYAGHLPLWLSPAAGGRRHHHLGRRRLRARGACRGRRALGCALRRPAQREDQYKVREHSLAKVPRCWWSAEEAAERTVSVRRLARRRAGSHAARRGIEGACRRAVPPDVRRMKAVA